MGSPVVGTAECIGCGACAELCPGVFSMISGKAHVMWPDGCISCDCELAARVCPVFCITFEG